MKYYRSLKEISTPLARRYLKKCKGPRFHMSIKFLSRTSHGSYVCVQAKGYPDYATKRFVRMLSEVSLIPILYVGDADPFGADIYFQYAFGNFVRIVCG